MELKAYKGDIYVPMYGGIADAKVYFKSEADKVIAEKDKTISEMKKACNSKDEWCLHTLKENRHHKYKRCVAMAGGCRLRARWFGDNAFYKKEQWALKWHRRWLVLAEKFKPNLTLQQKE